MSLNADASSPNSSREVTGTVIPNSPPVTRRTAADSLRTGRVRIRLNSSASRHTPRTTPAVDSATCRANALTGAIDSDLSMVATNAHCNPGRLSGW